MKKLSARSYRDLHAGQSATEATQRNKAVEKSPIYSQRVGGFLGSRSVQEFRSDSWSSLDHSGAVFAKSRIRFRESCGQARNRGAVVTDAGTRVDWSSRLSSFLFRAWRLVPYFLPNSGRICCVPRIQPSRTSIETQPSEYGGIQHENHHSRGPRTTRKSWHRAGAHVSAERCPADKAIRSHDTARDENPHAGI